MSVDVMLISCRYHAETQGFQLPIGFQGPLFSHVFPIFSRHQGMAHGAWRMARQGLEPTRAATARGIAVGGSMAMGAPQNAWFILEENPIYNKCMILGVPLFQETTILHVT